MSDLLTGIRKFCERFSSHVEAIHSLSNTEEWEVLQKSLYVAVVDSVGAIVFPGDQERNAIRFRKTILEFAKWPHATYFSIPYLHQYLKFASDKFYRKLSTELVNPIYEYWVDDSSLRSELPWIPIPGHRQVLSLDADVPAQLVLSKVDPANAKKVHRIARFQHHSLLYGYRNFLIHSLSLPGINDRPELMNYPYYEEYGVRDRKTGMGEIYFDLVYSSEFLYTMCRRVVANAAIHMQSREIDPYPRMQASTRFFWDPKVNPDLGELGKQMESRIRAQPMKWSRS